MESVFVCHISYDVYGVGNSLVDIQARIDDSILDTLQFTKGIMTLVDEGDPDACPSVHSGRQNQSLCRGICRKHDCRTG